MPSLSSSLKRHLNKSRPAFGERPAFPAETRQARDVYIAERIRQLEFYHIVVFAIESGQHRPKHMARLKEFRVKLRRCEQ